MCDQTLSSIPLPSGWTQNVKSAVLHVISLAHYAITCARGWAANSINARVRLAAKNDRLQQETELLGEEIRIKEARMARLDPRRRPYYAPTERMAILEIKADRGWSLAQTAKAFLVRPATIASWLKRIDEQGDAALVQLSELVNKFPDFIRYIVQRLKTLCPSLGKRKIAQILARAGLHLGSTTVQRMIKSKATRPPADPIDQTEQSDHIVTANRPDHVHHVDLTVVPTSLGMWTAWTPFALPQVWPFCWWTAVEGVFRKLEELPAAVYKEIESAFSMINELSCGRGTEAILEVGRAAGHDGWPLTFRTARNAYEIAFWAFLNHPDVFYQAGNFREMDRFRSWTRWYAGEGIQPTDDRESLTQLSGALSAVYAQQGRGRFCHVDAYVRSDPTRHCFFAFPEDHARTDMGYTESGKFVQRRPWRSAFEVILVYRPDEGVLEMHAQGSKDFKCDLAEAFCRTILGLDGVPPENGKVRYDLSVFKDRDFRFVTDPVDRVEAVHVRQLDFCLRQDPRKRVVLQAAPTRHDPKPVYQLLEKITTRAELALDNLEVTKARLRFVFCP
ncbi:MAG: hypothetical protein WBF17_16110, partial [Phycisphaerae bacterium]